MADEITFGYRTGHTLQYGVYDPTGSVVTAAGTSLPEEGATGYYHATDASIDALDFVIVTDSVTGVVVGQGQFSPDVTSASITIDIGDIETDISDLSDKLDLISVALNKVKNVYPIPPEPVRPIVSVSG